MQRVREAECEGQRAWLGDDGKGAEVLLSKLLGRTGCAEKLSSDECLLANFEFRCQRVAGICEFLIMLLGSGDFVFKHGVEIIQVDHKVMSLGGC